MADNNPYLVVGSPNYAAPLLDFSQLNPNAKKPQQGQQQQQGQPQNGQPQNQQPGAQNWAARLQSMFTPQQQAPVGPQASQLAGQPLNIAPGSVAGANTMLAGLY